MPLSHRTTRTVVKGREYPLGATIVDGGVNFALYSRNASAVFLLLFDTPAGEPTDVIQCRERDKFIWHAEVRGIEPGQLYGYKVQGDYRPEWGMRFNDAKLMLDPYAKAVTGKFTNQDNLLLAYDASPGGDVEGQVAGNVSGLHRDDSASAASRRQRSRVPARSRVLRRRLSDQSRAHQLLGVQLDWLLRARIVILDR